MKDRQQWLVWRSEAYQGDKKPRKVPYYVTGAKRRGEQGDDADRMRLATFERALAALASGKWTGIGFAFLPGDGLVGIDIDNAVDPDTGEVQPHLLDIIQRCGSYTERSPSRRGVHIIVEGSTETFKDNAVGVEVFCGRQFFTCSGDRWPDTPDEVRPIADAALEYLREIVRGARSHAPEPRPGPDPSAELRGRLEDALRFINPDASYEDWLRVGMGIKAAMGDSGFGLWKYWSSTGSKYPGDAEVAKKWASFDGAGVTEGSVFHLAKQCGWQAPKGSRKPSAAPATSRSAQPREGVAQVPDRPEGLDSALIRGGKGGGIVDCRENVFNILRLHPELTGLVAFNRFSHRAIKTRQPPWKSDAGDWTDQDDLQLGFWITHHVGITIKATRTITDGVAMAAYDNAFHPVLDFLDALPAWDGIERLSYWLSECAGAAETDYTRLVGPWFIMNLVRRVRHPGCQADYMVVLEGQQGKRKSTLLRTLVGNDDWFADTPMKIGDKDALLSLAGKWLYEFGELDSFGKAEATTVKQYLTSRIDRVREPFARRHEDRPRSCCFAGTTNQGEYIKDSTGGRRFWPVSCDDEINLQKMAEWRDQLFAEAEHRLRSDDADARRCWPTRLEEEKYLEPEQEARQIGDPWYDRIAWWVDSGRIPNGETSKAASLQDSFTSAELLHWALGVPFDRIDGGRQMTTRVGIVMHKLNWKKQRDSTGARIWRFVRPKTSAGGPATDSGEPDEGIVDAF